MSNSTIQPLVPPPNVDRGPLELGFTITLLSLALLFIAFRLHARIFLSKAVGWDDYFAVASVVKRSSSHTSYHLSNYYNLDSWCSTGWTDH